MQTEFCDNMAAAFPQGGFHTDESDNIVRKILKVVCRHQGCCIDLNVLQRTFQRMGQKVPRNLLGLLEDYNNNFFVEDNNVTAFTSLELCPKHCKRNGYCEEDYCEKLHICKFFLLSSCHFSQNGIPCQFGHDLDSEHNKTILQQNLLDELTDTEIQQLFQSRNSRGATTIPLICRFYNHLKGCTKNNTCPHLHICEYYIKGACKFGASCRRNHDIDTQIKRVLIKFGVNVSQRPKDILDDIRKMSERANNSNLQSQPMRKFSSMPMLGKHGVPPSRHQRSRPYRHSNGPENETDQTSDEICMYHLRGARGCWFKVACAKFHKPKIFQWQYLGETDTDWVDFEDYVNEKLESTFCNVERSECTVLFDESDSEEGDDDDEDDAMMVDFNNMQASDKGRRYTVRRLGTASHVALPQHIAKSFVGQVTRWIWYWYDDRLQQWRQYGNVGSEGQRSDIDSDFIEQAFARDQNGYVDFRVGTSNYRLRFAKFQQKNRRTNTRRQVRRRPTYM
ncbi:protein mono-ADP-ribosyltransferase PARP12-like isoform X1 [Haliotis rufescens]|uniref:protein mono-ADP-ribosyltransferase PARP12-like isoform X1 n=2 Tax=Haliotis rufescens TaxID=6454 RepID=UPI00201E8EEB|nr:protein mono-ADP-ribosyltransferase PARP12-like isoform X1 [Haliotis rufescens]